MDNVAHKARRCSDPRCKQPQHPLSYHRNETLLVHMRLARAPDMEHMRPEPCRRLWPSDRSSAKSRWPWWRRHRAGRQINSSQTRHGQPNECTARRTPRRPEIYIVSILDPPRGGLYRRLDNGYGVAEASRYSGQEYLVLNRGSGCVCRSHTTLPAKC